MTSYAEFKRVFLSKSNLVLTTTITNSQQRYDVFDKRGDVSGKQIELDRIQAAADVLDDRGYYESGEQSRPEKAGVSGGYAVGMAVLAVAVWLL